MDPRISRIPPIPQAGNPDTRSGALVTSDADPLSAIDDREFVERVWRAIRARPPRQRAALLLHMREADGRSALPLLTATGVATALDIAASVDIPHDALLRMWSTLPLDELQIGAQFGITGQQVVQLRRSARALLAHRLAAAGSSGSMDRPDAHRPDGDHDDVAQAARLAAVWRAEFSGVLASDHVAIDFLRAYVQGRLGDADREVVGSHVEICATCSQQASGLGERDTAPGAAPRHAARATWITIGAAAAALAAAGLVWLRC